MGLLRIKVTDNLKLKEEIQKSLNSNGGYCPCKIEKTNETKCICLEFLSKDSVGPCHCGLYEKVEV